MFASVFAAFTMKVVMVLYFIQKFHWSTEFIGGLISVAWLLRCAAVLGLLPLIAYFMKNSYVWRNMFVLRCGLYFLAFLLRNLIFSYATLTVVERFFFFCLILVAPLRCVDVFFGTLPLALYFAKTGVIQQVRLTSKHKNTIDYLRSRRVATMCGFDNDCHLC